MSPAAPTARLQRSLDTMRRDADRILAPWFATPRRRVCHNLVALARCFTPHPLNNNFRKLTTIVLFGVWATLSVGVVPPPSQEVYLGITILCFTILGQQWELEKLRLFGVDIGTSRDDEDGGDGDA